MNVKTWLAETSPHKQGLTAEQRQQMREYRAEVLKAAGTTINSLRVGLSGNRIGVKLTQRLAVATKGSMYEIKVLDQFPELA